MCCFRVFRCLGVSVLLLLASWLAGASANAPHPWSLQSQLAPHPRGCPPHTVYMESAVWWTTDNLSLPNATNYGRITMMNCWPHMAAFNRNYSMYPVTTVESSSNYSLPPKPKTMGPQGNGSLVISRTELAYMTGAWLDPCPFKYSSWRAPLRGYSTCTASNGTYAAGGDTWMQSAKNVVLGLIAGQTNGWPAPAVSAASASVRRRRRATRGLLQLSPMMPSLASPSPSSTDQASPPLSPSFPSMPSAPSPFPSTGGPALPPPASASPSPSTIGPITPPLSPMLPSPASPSPFGQATIPAPSGWSQICPQDVSKTFDPYFLVNLTKSSAASTLSAAASTCPLNCPFCNPQFVNNMTLNSSTSPAIAPVLPALKVCMYVDNFTVDTNRYPYAGQVAGDSGFFVYPRIYLTNPNETVPYKTSPGNGVRGFELVAGFGMVMHKTPGPVDMKRIQPFHYNRYDANELSTRVTAPLQGSTSAYIRPNWKLPIFGDLHWFLRVYDCSTDHPGSPMEQWTLALNADPVNGVAGMVIASGTRYYTGMVHVDTSALGLTSGWYNLCIIITARDPDTMALKTVIHRHWFQVLTDFPVQPNTQFIMYPNVSIPSITNWTDIDPRNNVLPESSVHVGTKAIMYPKTHWTQQYKGVMTFDFTDMKTMRCGFSTVTLYMFLKRIVMTARPGWIYGTNTTMAINILATTNANYFPPGTTRKSWNTSTDGLTLIGSLNLGLHEDVLQWHGFPLTQGWFNKYIYQSRAKSLTLVVSTPAVLDQHFYFAAVLDLDMPMPGPGYQPFLHFVPNC